MAIFQIVPRVLTVTFLALATVCLSGAGAYGQTDGLDSYVRAEKLRQANQFRAAIDEYEKAISEDSANYRFHYQKGKCYTLLRDEDNAILAFEQAAKLKSDYVYAHTRLAWLYQRKEKFEQTMAAFDSAFKYESDLKDRITYKLNIIKLLIRLNRFPEAWPHIMDVKAHDPDNLDALYYEAKHFNLQKKHVLAKESAKKAVARLTTANPKETARYYYELGTAFYFMEEYDSAKEAYKRADYGPYKGLIARRTPRYKYALASAYFGVYEFEKSKELLETALKMDQYFPYAIELLSKIAVTKADKSKVIAHLKNAINAETDQMRKSIQYEELAFLEFDAGQLNNVLNTSSLCLEIQPNNYKVAYLRQLALFRTGKRDEAVEGMKKLTTYPGLDFDSKSKFSFALGLMFKEMDDPDMAIRAFKSCVFGAYKFAAIEETNQLNNFDEESGVNDSDLGNLVNIGGNDN